MAAIEITVDVPYRTTGDISPSISMGGYGSEVRLIYLGDTVRLQEVYLFWASSAFLYPGSLDWVKLHVTLTKGDTSETKVYVLWDGWVSHIWNKAGYFDEYVGLSVTGDGIASVTLTVETRVRVLWMWKYYTLSVTV